MLQEGRRGGHSGQRWRRRRRRWPRQSWGFGWWHASARAYGNGASDSGSGHCSSSAGAWSRLASISSSAPTRAQRGRGWISRVSPALPCADP
eukprot:439878-Lingulodinium_polyedra.AAC.1